jgi:hypothetical protein
MGLLYCVDTSTGSEDEARQLEINLQIAKAVQSSGTLAQPA